MRSALTSPATLTLNILQTDTRAVANYYAAALQLCFNQLPSSYSLTRTVHAHMITSGFNPRGHILNRLIDIYCKSSKLYYALHLFDHIPQPDIIARTTLITAHSAAGNIKIAKEIFDRTPLSLRDTVCYNAMITAFSHNSDGNAAIEVFREMKLLGFEPDNFTFTSVLSALTLIADRETHCQQLHCVVVKSGTGFVTSVVNALISVYVKCASSPLVLSSSLMSAARRLFDEMPVRDELSWTTIITGYVRNDDLDGAKEVFDGMDVKLAVAWNSIISGYVHRGFVHEALRMFREMHLLGIKQDEFTYTSMFSACSDGGLFRLGKQLHAYIIRTEKCPSRDFLISVNNSLISFYSKCGMVNDAKKIFDKMEVRDLVSGNAVLSAYVNAGRIEEARSFFSNMPERNLLTWTVMISGFSQNGYGEEGIKLFNQMRSNGLGPCDYAYAGAITSCSVLAALENGRQLHAQLIQSGFDSSLSASNALITMYARCSVIEDADRVFCTMSCVDAVSWNAMIAALGQHGKGAQALDLFNQMLKEEILPDRITFLTILSACSHAGLVREGRHYFDSMYNLYGITPGEDHYARLIDLLCRAAMFSEAKDVIDKMPFEPGAPIWEALLSGCRLHGNIDVGVEAAERLFELVPQHDGTYVLLANMYATAGRWDEMAKARKLMRDKGVKKEPGCSWIEVENSVHVFLVNDIEHPEVQGVYDYLKELVPKMKKLGYVPDTKFALHDTESEQQENNLSTHSEKLAVVFGLLKLPVGATVRVFKNLRICGDCHNAFKFMSVVVGREIVVRDGKRFHHFKEGACSCGNYW